PADRPAQRRAPISPRRGRLEQRRGRTVTASRSDLAGEQVRNCGVVVVLRTKRLRNLGGGLEHVRGCLPGGKLAAQSHQPAAQQPPGALLRLEHARCLPCEPLTALRLTGGERRGGGRQQQVGALARLQVRPVERLGGRLQRAGGQPRGQKYAALVKG